MHYLIYKFYNILLYKYIAKENKGYTIGVNPIHLEILTKIILFIN